MDDLIRRSDAIRLAEQGQIQGFLWQFEQLVKLPSEQPDDRLAKIADLVEGTIDHFDLDDAMDLLYQIKDVIGER